MTTFDSYDGTRLAYHRAGEGTPLVCLPGGPMRSCSYLGDLGGLSGRHGLVLLDLRGTGQSDVPADPTSYRCDRQVDDVEALRVHLGLDRLDLAGHSAGASLALLYAAKYPNRIGRLVLINPSVMAVDVQVTDDDRRQVAELRRGEPWFPEAFAAFERIWAGDHEDSDWEAIAPFRHGRWHPARVRMVLADDQKNEDAAEVYYDDGAVDPEAVRAAIATLPARVLLLTGEYDVGLPPECAVKFASLFLHAELAIQPGGGHFAWLDDPGWVADTLARFLSRP